MRYKLLLLAFPALFVAARPHSTPPSKAAAAPAKPKAATNATSAFARLNLASLWRLAATAPDERQVHNGFFSQTRQRLEFAFTSVQRDAKNPHIYHVRGKDRRFRQVRTVVGTFTLAHLSTGKAFQPQYGEDKTPVTPGTATGTFVLQEQPGRPSQPSGTFKGKLAVDFLIHANKTLTLNWESQNAETRQGGFLLEGEWTTPSGGTPVAVLVKDGLSVTHQLMPRFDIGDRGMQLNPAYARVGWDTYWENEEWWADKPVARR